MTTRMFSRKNKMVSFGKKIPKTAKNDCTTTLELLCARNRSKKHLTFEKREHFENGQNWPRCKGHSLCKMLNLAQKLKMPKR